MGYNSKQTPLYTDPHFVWSDYFDEKKLDAFMEKLTNEVRDFVAKKVEEAFEEELKTKELGFYM